VVGPNQPQTNPVGLACLEPWTVLPKSDVPMGLALIFSGQLLGAAVFVSVGANVLGNQLLQKLSEIPEFCQSLITSSGATSILDSVPTKYQGMGRYEEARSKYRCREERNG
jgi:hypothetical protein